MASHCQLEMRGMQANSLNAYYLENVYNVETKLWRFDSEIPDIEFTIFDITWVVLPFISTLNH